MSKKFGGLGKGLDTIFAENETEDSNSSVMLKISEIEPNRSQPRRDFDENSLSDLAQSISQHGLLQPLLVRPLPIGGYQIVAGERRYRACRMAGLTEVPVTIRELSDTETMELALIENLQREDLSPIEEALGYKALIDEHGFSQEEVATSVLIYRLMLQLLPAELIYKKDLSVRQAEKLAKKKPEVEEDTQPERKPSFYSMVELALNESLGRKIKVNKNKGKQGGVLQIEFYSDEELTELSNKLK